MLEMRLKSRPSSDTTCKEKQQFKSSVVTCRRAENMWIFEKIQHNQQDDNRGKILMWKPK